MDPRERIGDREEALRTMLDGRQAAMHTCLPGIIQSFDPDAMTVEVQPAVMFQVRNQAGVWNNVKLPVCVDCPVHFPSGGGFTLTFPLAAGDECILVFAERCIDAWFQSSGVQPQAEFRMHDLSDGFCIPKVWSKPNTIPGISVASTQLRTDDGECFVDVSLDQITLNTPDGSVLAVGAGQITLRTPDGGSLVLGVGKAQLHGSVEASIDGNGLGVVYHGDTNIIASFTLGASATNPAPDPPGPLV